MERKKFIAIILARGGSKGIKNKNLTKVGNKPLLYWSLEHCKKSKKISNYWVSSDSKKILNYAKIQGANIIKRPKKLSTDKASSEEGWLHAIKEIKKKGHKFTEILAIQATSPLRSNNDFDNAIKKYVKNRYDSLFSALPIRDHFIWKLSNKKLIANYDYRKRKPRQKILEKYLENGSFFIFNVNKFKKYKCRFFERIGVFIQKKINSFQIDEIEDIEILNSLIKKDEKK